jgi:DNA-binding CsgD family transcriptional regulator
MAMPLEGQIVAAAEQWVSHRTRRPWREELSDAQSLDRACSRTPTRAASTRRSSRLARLRAAGHASEGRAAPAQDDQSLSQRELEVLRCISRGDNTKQVARALSISPSTVRTHVERVFRKLGCSTRAAATLKASTRGLL